MKGSTHRSETPAVPTDLEGATRFPVADRIRVVNLVYGVSGTPRTPTDRSLLSVEVSGSALLTPARQAQLLLTFMVLGVAARCVRYLLCFPLWEDECFLCVNFIDRGFLDLLEPLQYHQVAPPLFLWLELAAVKLLGYSEWSLRLCPFLCSIASLFLFRRLASRLLQGPALVLAVAVFAAAYPGVRYAAEAKQYSFDLIVALALLTMTVEWWRCPAKGRGLWALAAFLPLALGVSYPAVFVAGGISLVIAFVLWTARDRRGWAAWIVYNAVLAGSFGVLFLLAGGTQSGAELDFMREFWQDAFPPLAEPLRLPLWLLRAHSGDLLGWPVGGGRGGSTLTFLGCLAGLVLLLRRRQWTFLLLCLAPAVLQLAAAALRRYPYGGHVKFSLPLAAAICLLAGIGTATLLARLVGRPRLLRIAVIASLLFPLAAGVGVIVRDVLHPCKTLSDMRARAFARWFWFNTEFEGETVCLKTDLHQDFSPDTYRELSWTAMYLCNQQIYSPRHQAHQPPHLDRVTADHPLRCALYRDPQFPFDQQAFDQWLADMQTRYRLTARETYAFPRYDHRERMLVKVEYLDVLQFVPQAAQPASRASTMPAFALEVAAAVRARQELSLGTTGKNP